MYVRMKTSHLWMSCKKFEKNVLRTMNRKGGKKNEKVEKNAGFPTRRPTFNHSCYVLRNVCWELSE